MNVLITGACGTVGIQTVAKLTEQAEKISIYTFDIATRKNKKKLSAFKDKINAFYGDISDYQTVAEICKNIDVVIHLAAIIPPLADEKPILASKVNIEGTRNIVKALPNNNPDAFIIYTSSVSVYGDRIKNPFIKTSDPLLPSESDEYAKTKIEAEKIIQNSNLNWTIFRLSAIFGIKNHKITKLMFHMPLETQMEITTAEDTAVALSKAVFKIDELNGKIFNLGGGENCRISYKKFLERNFKIYGLGKLNFPENTFATQNFHCGYYADGDELEKILHFRHDTIDTYFSKIQKNISPATKYLTKINAFFIKKILISKSEPFKAIKNKNIRLINRFFSK